jgi:NADH-quinone oxidoreductase subunit J
MVASSILVVSPLVWPIGPCVLLGLIAIALLLPRPLALPQWYGAVVGAVALLLASATLIRVGAWSPEVILFYVFSAIAITGGALLITQRNPARAALAFALVVLSTCGLFLLQAAPFLMAATIIIYAGAIIVTFLFILMLAQQRGSSDADLRSREPFLAATAGFVLLGALIYVLFLTYRNPKSEFVLDQLDALVAKGVDASKKSAPEQVVQALDWDKFFEEAPQLAGEGAHEPRLAHLQESFRRIEGDGWLNVKLQPVGEKAQFLQGAVAEMRQALDLARHSLGDLQPQGQRISEFSGAKPSNVPKYDALGQAALPAENVAYLGRSLFTDYLLAVELGGTLLLVATIGAIAIANRRNS